MPFHWLARTIIACLFSGFITVASYFFKPSMLNPGEKNCVMRNVQRLCLLIGILLLFVNTINAQEATDSASVKQPSWETNAGFGLDFAQLLQINPKQGAGLNRLGFGSAITLNSRYTRSQNSWETTFSWQFGLQQLGAGVLAQGSDQKIPFQKALDELRLNSKFGNKTAKSSKWFYSVDFSFLSQLAPTYAHPAYSGNFLSNFEYNETSGKILSKLLSPATITLAVGMDYKPNDRWSLFYSPLGSKFLIVADDEIARRGIHGNPVGGTKDSDGNFPEFKNIDRQIGTLLRIKHQTKFWEKKAYYKTNLLLYSNYLNNPQNIDIDWANELGVVIFKGLNLNLNLNIFYDDDVKVQITNNDFPNGVSGLGKRVSVTQQFLLKYIITI